MKILITSPEQHTLTGQPNYCKNIKNGLEELGHEVIMSENPSGDYDVAIINDYYSEVIDKFTAKKIFNICHSKYGSDRQIDDKRIDKYLVPRKEISDYWNIKADILPIPIDIKRWNIPLINHQPYRILSASTIDYLRVPMLQNLCDRANNNCEVWIVGKDCGNLKELRINEHVKVFGENNKIEELMCQCDEVAGIFIGTITLEAWAMGLKTSIYDESGKWEYIEKPEDFNKHSHIEVAKKLIELTEL